MTTLHCTHNVTCFSQSAVVYSTHIQLLFIVHMYGCCILVQLLLSSAGLSTAVIF